MKPGSDMGYRSASEIKASATQCSTGALLRMLRHGGSQPRKQAGASHPARCGKNAEAFLKIRSGLVHKTGPDFFVLLLLYSMIPVFGVFRFKVIAITVIAKKLLSIFSGSGAFFIICIAEYEYMFFRSLLSR